MPGEQHSQPTQTSMGQGCSPSPFPHSSLQVFLLFFKGILVWGFPTCTQYFRLCGSFVLNSRPTVHKRHTATSLQVSVLSSYQATHVTYMRAMSDMSKATKILILGPMLNIHDTSHRKQTLISTSMLNTHDTS